MKVVITDTFVKSFERLAKKGKFPYKQWEILRYDVPNFLRNLWHFRKELWKYRWWDATYSVRMLKKGLEPIPENLRKHGLEVSVTKDKKIQKIERLLYLLDNFVEDKYIEIAEKELGEISKWDGDLENISATENDRKIFKRTREIEEAEWEEIWKILKGQGNYPDKDYEDHDKAWEDYAEWCDGSDLRGWWD